MDKLTQLLEVADQPDQAELKILHNAQISCAKAYHEEPTLARKRDWDAAKAGLQEAIDRLWLKYAGSDESMPADYRSAAEYLRRSGYKIGKSKLGKDYRRGLIPRQESGVFLPRDLERYAQAVGLERLATDAPALDEVGNLQETKTRREIEKLEEEIRRRRFEYERETGRYIERERLELELAARAAALDSGLRTKLKSKAKLWVAMVQGRPEHTPALMQDILSTLDETMNEFARMDRFHVIFGSEMEEAGPMSE
jgi:hypothetical protein